MVEELLHTIPEDIIADYIDSHREEFAEWIRAKEYEKDFAEGYFKITSP